MKMRRTARKMQVHRGAKEESVSSKEVEGALNNNNNSSSVDRANNKSNYKNNRNRDRGSDSSNMKKMTMMKKMKNLIEDSKEVNEATAIPKINP